MLAYVLLRGIQQRMRERRRYCFDRLCNSSEGILSDSIGHIVELSRKGTRRECRRIRCTNRKPPLQGGCVLRHEVTDHFIALGSLNTFSQQSCQCAFCLHTLRASGKVARHSRAVAHISYRFGTDFRLLFFLFRRRAVLSGISATFLLVVAVSHGDVSLGVPSCSGACSAPSQEAREFRCRARNVGPYQATTPQPHSRFGTDIPCTRRRSNLGLVCETLRVVIFSKSSAVRACEFH